MPCIIDTCLFSWIPLTSGSELLNPVWNQGLRRKYMILAISNNKLYIMPYKDKYELWYSSFLLVDDMYLHWKTFVQSKI